MQPEGIPQSRRLTDTKRESVAFDFLELASLVRAEQSEELVPSTERVWKEWSERVGEAPVGETELRLQSGGEPEAGLTIL